MNACNYEGDVVWISGGGMGHEICERRHAPNLSRRRVVRVSPGAKSGIARFFALSGFHEKAEPGPDSSRLKEPSIDHSSSQSHVRTFRHNSQPRTLGIPISNSRPWMLHLRPIQASLNSPAKQVVRLEPRVSPSNQTARKPPRPPLSESSCAITRIQSVTDLW